VLKQGIRTFESCTRNTLDLSAVPAIHELTHLPAIIDPTHNTGRLTLIGPMSMAAGADGLFIEVHYRPQEAFCDANQALAPEMFSDIMGRIRS
jgi:3-deoxy-7-phosphoheptulonate synthase